MNVKNPDITGLLPPPQDRRRTAIMRAQPVKTGILQISARQSFKSFCDIGKTALYFVCYFPRWSRHPASWRPAGSFLGGFRTPASERACNTCDGPASETLHPSGPLSQVPSV